MATTRRSRLVRRLGDALQDNIHLTFWQADERTDAGVPDGWGAQFSFSGGLRKRWLPFLRIGYANGSGAALDRSLSTGFAYDAPGRDSVSIGAVRTKAVRAPRPPQPPKTNTPSTRTTECSSSTGWR